RPRRGIMALFPPPADDVEAAFDYLEQAGDVRRIVLQVSVYEDQVFATGMLNAGGDGRGLPKVSSQPDHARADVTRSNAFELHVACVGAPVVHIDDLEGPLQSSQS